MYVKMEELIRWKGKQFANKVKKAKMNNDMKHLDDLLRPYNINKKIGRGGLKMYRTIKR